MARSLWTGAISFGLVNVPVRLHSATSQKEIRFHMLHEKDGARVQLKRFCSAENREIPYDEIAKGYEISRGQYVKVAPEELEALDPKGSRTIDIQEFVDLSSIDPVYYERTYYLSPDRGAAKAYALLLEAMRRTGKVAIARMVMRSKQYLCLVRPMGDALSLSTMLYADEVVSHEDLELPVVEEAPKKRELEMAEQLVESLSADFEPEKFRDEYRDRVQELIEKKAEGQEIVAPPTPEPGKVINLADALKQSLASARRREAPEKIETRTERPAARTRKATTRKSTTTRKKKS